MYIVARVTSRIDILAPATIGVLAGTGTVSSLGELPPEFAVTDPNTNGTITVTLIASNAATVLSAGSAGGATVSSSGNTVAITGDAAQVNAALATLEITEAASATSDIITVTASDPQALPAHTAIAVRVTPDTGPAFANPPGIVTLHANAVSALPGLVIGDPQVTALNQAGQGTQESMAVTLAAASGILLLPGFSALSGISAAGLGTGTIVLDFTADQLGAVNALLAGLEFAGPAAQSGLAYSLRYIAGPLPSTVTAGNIQLDIAGSPGSNGTFQAGNQTLILGVQSLAASTTLTIDGTTADLGGIAGQGAVIIGPDAALNLPYNDLSLGGTSLDFGTLQADNFLDTGDLIIADSITFNGAATFAGEVDFIGNLIGGNTAAVSNQLGISLDAGALLIGTGTITAGNFSEAGRISGAGTISALAGETILIAAASIGGGAELQVQGGGVMILGPVSPLYGVFNPTPLTIDSSVTLAFANDPGPLPITGIYGDAIGQSGGVFVISGPQAFAGTITGFVPGDRLIFPGLTNVSLFNITADSFEVGGLNSNGTMVTYQIDTAYPAGTSVYASTDNEGDPEIGLRGTTTEVFLAGNTIATADIYATAGTAQPIQGLQLLLTASTTHTLTVTLSVANGVLADDGFGPNATITLTAPNVIALNAELASLTYTGNGRSDVLTVSSGTGVLAGLDVTAFINGAAAGTLSGFGGLPPTEGQVADFVSGNLLAATADAAPGELLLSGNVNFAAALQMDGISGTALLINDGATGLFDAAASVAIEADVTIGNAAGAGTLDILTDNFTIGANGASANLTIGGVAAAAGSAADVFGTLGVSSNLLIGTGGAATLNLAGNLGEATTTLGGAGRLVGYGGAVVAFGALTDAGAISFTDQAAASTSTIGLTGLLALGGAATLEDFGNLAIGTGGTLQIGPDASLSAVTLTMTGGTILDTGTLALGTLLSGAGIVSLAGGTISAAGFTVGGTSTLSGTGILAPTGSIANKGTIIAAGGSLLLGGDVSNTGAVIIAAGATLDAVHTLNGAVAFSGTGAELIVNDSGVFTAVVSSFAGHDVIDLVGVAPSLVIDSGGTVTIGTGTNAIGSFALGVISGQPAISIVSDGAGGALITLGDEMPCFARGTRLLTPTGYRPVQALAPGDALITLRGGRRQIRWIGRRTLDFASTRARAALPVLIMPGAFGRGQPVRPLRLSPLHAVFWDGVLVPAVHLVNGATILREAAGAAVTYHHVELDRHDVVLAEGLPCETYLDTGNRSTLYDEAGIRSPSAKACAALVTSGPRLAAIRRQLHERALAAGFSLTYQPVLRAVAGEQTSLPEIIRQGQRRIARLTLPRAARQVTLLSRCASPADTDPDSEDRRDLALCLGRAQTGAGQPVLGQGWLPRAPQDNGHWMGPRADLLLRRPADSLTLSLAAVIRTWRSPETRL